MNLKLYLIAVFLFLNYHSNAQISHEFIEVEKSKILTKIVINKVNNISKVLVFTEDNQSREIRFTPYVLEFNRGELVNKRKVIISPLNENKWPETRINALREIDSNRFLLVSMSRKKKRNSLVFRVFNENGDEVEKLLFSVNSEMTFYNLQVKDDGKFIVCLKEFKSDDFKFVELDSDLKVLRTVSNPIPDKTMKSNGFYVKGDFVYVMNTWITEKDTDYSKPQCSIYQLDLRTGKINNKYHFVNNKFHFKFQFLLMSNSIEIICNEMASISRFRSGIISCIKIDLSTFQSIYKKTVINFFEIAWARPKSTKNISSVNDYSFRVEKDIRGNYVFFIRSASERKDFETKSNGMVLEKFDTKFNNSVVLVVDSLLENIISKQIINNKLSFLDSYMSFLYLLNNRNYDLNMYTLPSDTSKYLLTYMVNPDIWGKDGNRLVVKLNNSGEYNYDSIYTIEYPDKKVKDFQHASLEELSEGVFLVKVSLWGASDSLLIIKADLKE